MSIQEFLVNLESGKERSSLFTSLGRLRKVGDLRALVLAAAGDPSGANGGWVSWQDAGSQPTDYAAVAGA